MSRQTLAAPLRQNAIASQNVTAGAEYGQVLGGCLRDVGVRQKQQANALVVVEQVTKLPETVVAPSHHHEPSNPALLVGLDGVEASRALTTRD
jgi:hypothetical protein